MDTITISPKDAEQTGLCYGTALPGDYMGLYVVVFARNDDEDADYWGGDPKDTAGAIQQFRKELQYAYDAGHLAGNFNIVGRFYDGEYVSAAEAMKTRPYRITVRNAKGEDVSEVFAASQSIDGGRVEGTAIGSFNDLSHDEARICLSQLIDSCHEWGQVEDQIELLYKLAEQAVKDGKGIIATPDGYVLTVVNTVAVTS